MRTAGPVRRIGLIGPKLSATIEIFVPCRCGMPLRRPAELLSLDRNFSILVECLDAVVRAVRRNEQSSPARIPFARLLRATVGTLAPAFCPSWPNFLDVLAALFKS